MSINAAHNNTRARTTSILTLLALIATLLLPHTARAAEVSGMFASGVTVDGLSIAGMTFDQAAAAVAEHQKQVDGSTMLTLTHGEKRYQVSLYALSTYDTQDVLVRAYEVGRFTTADPSTTFQTTRSLRDIEQSGVASDILRQLGLVEMKNATVETFNVSDKTFTYAPEQTGYVLDVAELSRRIQAVMNSGGTAQLIEVPVTERQPDVTLKDVKAKCRKLATFTTTTTDNSARNTNIKLCAGSFNGARIDPGETFSLNATTGERTEAKGYKPAGAIVNGVLVEEPGGGVCQVSTTLMNAVVRAGLTLTSRSHHSWPSTYVKIGMDAAVNYPDTDFKFTNNGNGPVFLVSSFSKNKLTVSVYGYELMPKNETIDLSSKLLSTTPAPAPQIVYDPTIKKGKTSWDRESRDEKKSETYIIYSTDGKETRREILFQDTYKAIQGIQRVGTK